MNRGELWWLEHPEIGRRPACIVTRQAAIPVLNAVLVAPATRTVRRIPTEVPLGRDEGLPDDCVLALDSLGAVPKAMLTERIGRLGPAKLAQLCAAVAVTTGC